jgi:hypothetical protein
MTVGCVSQTHRNRSVRGTNPTHTKEILKILGLRKSTYAISPGHLVGIEVSFRGLPHTTSSTGGADWLIVSLQYGSGLRLMESLRLRVKDIDFEYNQIVVRDGKGNKDRVTMLPNFTRLRGVGPSYSDSGLPSTPLFDSSSD